MHFKLMCMKNVLQALMNVGSAHIHPGLHRESEKLESLQWN